MTAFEIRRVLPRGGDNYNYLLVRNGHALWVDPIYPLALLKKIKKDDLILDGILITHTHWDHIDGVEQVLEKYPVPVYVHTEGMQDLSNIATTQAVDEGDTISCQDLVLTVHHLPGHHPAHVLYLGGQVAVLGDILFRAGCGSPLFGGNMEQIFESLARLPKLLAAEDRLLWGHNYDQTNLAFAHHYWPDDHAIAKALNETKELEEGLPPLITTFAVEAGLNPFLRLDHPDLHQALLRHVPQLPTTPREVFFALRGLRNTWNGEP